MENNYLLVLTHTLPRVDVIDVTRQKEKSDFNSIVHKRLHGCYDIVRFHNNFVLLVDDCGALIELPFNYFATLIYHTNIYGDVVVCKEVLTNEGLDLDYLNEDDIKLFAQLLFDYICT